MFYHIHEFQNLATNLKFFFFLTTATNFLLKNRLLNSHLIKLIGNIFHSISINRFKISVYITPRTCSCADRPLHLAVLGASISDIIRHWKRTKKWFLIFFLIFGFFFRSQAYGKNRGSWITHKNQHSIQSELVGFGRFYKVVKHKLPVTWVVPSWCSRNLDERWLLNMLMTAFLWVGFE